MSLELAQTRDHGFGSVPPISQREIMAFQYNTHRRLSPFQVRCLIAIDTVKRTVWLEHRDKQKQQAKDAEKTKQKQDDDE